MIQFTILFVFFIFHILFFLNYFLFGITYNEFFGIQNSYAFDSEIAFKTFTYATISLISIAIGLYSNKFLKFKAYKNTLGGDIYNTTSFKLFALFCTSIAIFNAFSIVIDQIGYGLTAALRSNKTTLDAILYEIRYITLIYISYNLLNYRIKDLLKSKTKTYTIIISIIYLISCLILKTRSIIFELGFVYIYAFLLWDKNKIKFKYIIYLIAASIIPNIMLLFRVDLFQLNFGEIISSIFKYEYPLTLANLISANISGDGLSVITEGYTFLSKLYILIPSFLRNIFDIQGGDSLYYFLVQEISGARGGGFSFIGELYTNFAEFSYLILFLFGLLIARMIAINYKNLGSSSIIAATYPLIISNFILVLRNDIFPFIKITIYLLLVAVLMKFISQIKILKL